MDDYMGDEDESKPSYLKMWLLFELIVAVLIWNHLGTEGVARKTCKYGADELEQFEKTCAKLEKE